MKSQNFFDSILLVNVYYGCLVGRKNGLSVVTQQKNDPAPNSRLWLLHRTEYSPNLVIVRGIDCLVRDYKSRTLDTKGLL